MTILRLLISLAVIVITLLWRASRVPIRHRWRRPQARILRAALSGRDRSPPPSLICARLRAMDALAIEELMPERVERRRDRVVRDGRYTSDGGTGGRMVLDGRVWLIQAKRHAGTIRPRHVRVFAVLRDACGAPGLPIHTRRAARSDRDLVTQHGEVDNISIHRLPAQITGGPLAIEGWAL